jgi:hypothetical protein
MISVSSNAYEQALFTIHCICFISFRYSFTTLLFLPKTAQDFISSQVVCRLVALVCILVANR